jgi:hypothetical protein
MQEEADKQSKATKRKATLVAEVDGFLSRTPELLYLAFSSALMVSILLLLADFYLLVGYHASF